MKKKKKYFLFNNTKTATIAKKQSLIREEAYETFMTPKEDATTGPQKWFQLREIDKTAQAQNIQLRDDLRKQSVAQLEAQLHEGNFPMACINFSGEPGFSLHEKELLRQAMGESIQNSARTIVACELAKLPYSDVHEKIKEFFAYAPQLQIQKLMLLMNQIHNLATDPTQTIEFIDDRNNPDYHFTRPNPAMKINVNTVVYVSKNLLHFGKSSPIRGFSIYQQLINGMIRSDYSKAGLYQYKLPCLYKYALDQYVGTIKISTITTLK